MAHYSKEQLWDSGSLNEELNNGDEFFFVNNSSGSSYFTFEILKTSEGWYDQDSQTLKDISFTDQNNVYSIITSSYIFSAVLGPQSSSFRIELSDRIPANSGYFRATGEVYLDII